MCDVYIVLYEAYLGPKAADLRVYPVVKCEGVGEETGATHDHSQVKKHGKSLWDQVHKFHLADPRREVPSFDIEFFTKCKLSDDEMLASTMLDEGTMRGFIFGPGKVHDVKAKIQSSEELSHFNLTSAVSKKQHDYYMKYRLLITAAGVDPSPEQLNELKALSPKFDPSAGKGTDGEMPHERVTAVVAELNRTPVFRLLRQFIFAVVALAAAMSGFYDIFSSKGIRDHTQYINMEQRPLASADACVPLFDKVERLVNKKEGDIVLYTYTYTTEAVGVCTDRDQGEFDSEIGSEHRDDILSQVTGGACTLPGYYAGTDNVSGCSHCGLGSASNPYGLMWAYDIIPNVVTAAPHVCSIDSNGWWWQRGLGVCNKAHVYFYSHNVNMNWISALLGLFISSLVIIQVRLVAELRGVIAFHMPCCSKLCCCCGPNCCGYSGHKSILYRMSSRGLFGPLSLLYQMVRGCTTRVPPIDPPPLPLDVALYLLEMIPNVVQPLYSIWGCTSGNWRPVTVVVLGLIKTLIMTCIFGKNVVDRIIAWRNPEEPDDLHDVLITSGDSHAYSPRSSMAISLQRMSSGDVYERPTSDGFKQQQEPPQSDDDDNH